jgi:membrane protein implicated in regulation of membrane protease activity
MAELTPFEVSVFLLQLEVFGMSVSLLLVLVGAGLVVAEALAPGAHFIVAGVALLVAGLVGLLLPPSLAAFTPFVLAALVIVTGGAALFVYRQFDFYGGKGAGRTSDSASLRGKTGRVTERVTEREGAVKLDEGGFNPHYQARTIEGEIPVGETVIVVDPGGGNVITVASLEGTGDEIDRELAKDREGERAGRDQESGGDDESETDTEPERPDTVNMTIACLCR